MTKVFDFKQARMDKIIRQYAEFYHVDLSKERKEEDTSKQQAK